jgi:stage III sporulation protein AH
MINKKNLWFLTLFSLILVLSVYYVTMPTELLLNPNNTDNEGEDNSPVVNVLESELLTALRVAADEELDTELDALKIILTNINTSIDDKNNAYEKMKQLNIIRGEEEKIEKQILDEYKLRAFVKIDGDQIKVTVASATHDNELANNIMRTVQANYEEKMYISVKFQK